MEIIPTIPIPIPLYRSRLAAANARIGASWLTSAKKMHFEDLISNAVKESAHCFDLARWCHTHVGGAL